MVGVVEVAVVVAVVVIVVGSVGNVVGIELVAIVDVIGGNVVVSPARNEKDRLYHTYSHWTYSVTQLPVEFQ